MHLDLFPRVLLGGFPTPVYKLEAMSRYLNTQVYIKRDDLSALALGGNKARMLELLMGDARARGAQVIFTTGTPQRW